MEMEMEMDFMPVQHPMEPLDEDRPIKCPLPTSSSSSFNDGKEGEEEEERVAAERWLKIRSEQPEMVKKGIVMEMEPPLRAVRKRQHALTHHNDRHIIRKPLVRNNFTIFQMLQEFDHFNS